MNKAFRFLGKTAKTVTQTVLLPLTIVIWIETWWRVSAPKDECQCGCDWQKGPMFE